MPHTLILYGKPDCHLCHEAEELLVLLRHEYAFTFEKVNILDDRALETKYRYAIPVIVLDGRVELEAPILERELRSALL
jgi:glutaredoxin